MHRSLQTAVAWYFILFTIYKGVHKGEARAYLMGGGGGVQPPPPPEIFRFFFEKWKKRGRKEKKKMRRDVGGEG